MEEDFCSSVFIFVCHDDLHITFLFSDAAPYFDLIKKTDIPNDRKAINLNKFSTTLGFEHFQVKAIIMNRDRSVEETLHEIFDKWCTEMPNKAIKGTFVKALSNAGLVDVAKLVASSVVESDH